MGKIENCKIDNSMTKFFVMVYGCQYNVWDASRINFLMKQTGCVESNEEDADIIFALSCSVRKSAVDRILGKIKNWQGKKIVVTGCVLPDDRPKFLKKNVVLWDSEKPSELVEILNNCHSEQGEESHHKKILRFTQDDVGKLLSLGNSETQYVPITIGCNNFCSYCAVPYTRGRERSRKQEDIIEDSKKLVVKGAKEIMLLGQNVNSYKAEGKKLKAKSNRKNDFARLLEQLNNIDEDFIISFTSNHPKDMSDDIIAAVRDLPKVKKEIHLPLQSGSNKILKAMNRPYTKEQYTKLIKRIRKEIPEIKISTDVIVGFPGETEEDFEETLDLFKELNFTQAFVNKYSPRKGTAAFKLGDPIPWAEKERRWRILNEIANEN